MIAPVDAPRFKPAGSAPDEIEKVKIRVPPPATRKELYATPSWPVFTGHETVTGGAAETVATILQLWVAVVGVPSTTLTLKEVVPAPVGVPLIAPVDVFKVKPAGSDPVKEYA